MSDLATRLQASLKGRYRLGREIGRGGMATVFLADDLKHDRKVALKVLDPGVVGSTAAERFHREIQIAAGLQHPNILPLFDSGETDGLFYFVMPFVEGESLQEKLEREGPLPPEEAVRITEEVASGLAYAHGRGLIHRDIKPGNVLLSDGHAVLADFGIAGALERPEGEALTRTGQVIGTPAYMSPEQWSGAGEADARSDLYSLACVLFEMLTGEPPYTGPSAAVLLAGHTSDPVPSARDHDPMVSRELDRIVCRGLAKSPDDRFPDAEAFATVLREGVAPEPEGGRPLLSSAIRVLSGRPVRNAALGLLLLGGGYAGFTSLDISAASPAQERIAVLPFSSVGPAEREPLASGVTEEITTGLGILPSLSVIAPTSARRYRDTDKTVDEIAEELGVDYLVQGSIRWPGDATSDSSPAVSVRLVRASDRTLLWASDYEQLGGSLSGVDDRIVEEVAGALEASPSSSRRERLTERRRPDDEAWELFHRGKSHYDRSWSETDVRRAIELYEQAVDRDPGFALALAQLGRAHAWMYRLHYDHTPSRLDMARAAIDSALALDPEEPAAYVANGAYYYWGHHDYPAAIRQFERAIALNPSHALAYRYRGNVQRRQGDFDQALSSYGAAAELDPNSPTVFFNLGETNLFVRRFGEAKPHLDRALELAPDMAEAYIQKARTVLGEDGDTAEARRILESAQGEIGASRWWGPVHRLLPIVYGDEAVLERLEPGRFGLDTTRYHSARAELLGRLGRLDEASAHWDSARVRLERELAGNESSQAVHAHLSLVYAGLGEAERAVEHAERAARLLPVSADAFDGPSFLINLAMVHMKIGELDQAVAHLREALATPSWLSRGLLQTDPVWDPLRAHPGFVDLLRAERRAAVVPAPSPG